MTPPILNKYPQSLFVASMLQPFIIRRDPCKRTYQRARDAAQGQKLNAQDQRRFLVHDGSSEL